jgi:small subunit ribosomal protein S9
MAEEFWRGTGRRKTSVAQVRLMSGTGRVVVNEREIDVFLFDPKGRKRALAPLEAVNSASKFDISATVRGGGYSAQADALRLGIARALVRYDTGLESILRDGGYLTRDGREKERKKYGHKRARKSFQFSKR